MIIYSRNAAPTDKPVNAARVATRVSQPEGPIDAVAWDGHTVAAARPSHATATRASHATATRVEHAEASRGSRAEASRGSRAEASRGSRAEASRGSRAEASRGSRAEASRGSRAEVTRGSPAEVTRGSHAAARVGPSRPAGPRRAAVRPALVRLRHTVTRLGHAAADLALGSTCAGCGEHAGLLCPPCRAALLGPEARVRTIPGRPDLPLAGAAAYAGAVRAAIIEHKERGRLPLAAPLGDALAVAITAATAQLAASTPDAVADRAVADRAATHLAAIQGAAPPLDPATRGALARANAPLAHQNPDPVVLGNAATGHATHGDRPIALVPVPSAPSAVRHRGHDPVLRSARRAAATLQRSGQRATVVRCLRHGRRVADQAGLDRHEREHNLHGSLVATAAATRRATGCCVVIVDDVMTTGATLRESARALEAAGVRPCAAAVVAVV
ncbi:ComF family protein [Jiangella sp. DSM 45060]|uniref:ComF family protein n=1 Tax=Jiangella sp. DSM 45060 TaxID=1798224 RepID=UPI00087D35BA|nr:phosphoribosyltransferase family protein [Jiangella sp. DSM 45060]SDS17218.1 Phosphoribosyl transferase domain-containing protein [Jiangella sp. DSM 45060]